MPSTQPNIVLFFTDQLRADVLGCYGNQICKTPHIDRLATQGVIFNNAYTTSPVCSPSRASLMTGLYPHNHGVMLNTHIGPAWSRGLSREVTVFSDILKDNGYRLDYAGKWHVHQDIPADEYGFDTYESLQAILLKNKQAGREAGKLIQESGSFIEFPYGDKVYAAGAVSGPKENYPAWQVVDAGIEMIKGNAKRQEPFFTRIDITPPHFGNTIPEPYASMYDPNEIPPWPNFDETFVGKPASHLKKHQDWNLQDKDWGWWKQVVAKYYGDVSLIDDLVGLTLRAIEDAGIADNTIFIFSTDHGDSTGSHKHFEKAGTMYEEVFKNPLIMRLPNGMAQVKEVNQYVRLMDLMPTFVDWAGGEIPEKLDGNSIVPLLQNQVPEDWPDSVYAEHHGEVWGYSSQRMVKTDQWKYVMNAHDLDELYDLQKDPWEMKNIINEETFSTVLTEMKARMLGWNDATGDMFKWPWVRYNFPDPVLPGDASSENLPLTCMKK